MTIEVLKSKIHRATITGADLNYVGSISLDPALIEASGLREFEKVDVLDITNGSRLTTYVIVGGPGEVTLNGAAARLVHKGDLIIVVSYAQMTPGEADSFRPDIVLVDENNRMTEKLSSSGSTGT